MRSVGSPYDISRPGVREGTEAWGRWAELGGDRPRRKEKEKEEDRMRGKRPPGLACVRIGSSFVLFGRASVVDLLLLAASRVGLMPPHCIC